MQTTILDEEMKIIELFKDNVYGRSPDTNGFNQSHDGKDGHWLERQMGIAANANNEPDLYGVTPEFRENSTIRNFVD